MKKTIALILVLTVLLGAAVCATGEEAAYDMTQLFLEWLDREGIPYSYKGIVENNYEKVIVTRNVSGAGPLQLIFFFDPDEDIVSIRIWYLIEYDTDNFSRVVTVCDSLNGGYKFAKFYTDSSDNSVTVAMDVILMDTGDAGRILLQAMDYVIRVVEKGYPELQPYNK